MELIVTGSSSDQKFGVELPDFVWIRRLRISFDFERSRFRVHLAVNEISFLRVLDSSGQATKGAWGMSWYRKAMKGVEVCEKPGGVDKRTLILGFLNCSCAESIGAWRQTR